VPHARICVPHLPASLRALPRLPPARNSDARALAFSPLVSPSALAKAQGWATVQSPEDGDYYEATSTTTKAVPASDSVSGFGQRRRLMQCCLPAGAGCHRPP
jgi:hypothetical protein